MEKHKTSDIAVIGMACRFPGAGDHREFWKNLTGAVHSVSEIPSDRWDWRAINGDPNKEPGRTNVKYGGFIDDIDKFDPMFFGIPPKEADCMDPQHRIFLECVWHAVEDAGIRAGDLSGTRTGVYCGVSKNDYTELMRELGVEIAPFISTGTVHSLVSNRVSFFLGTTGPSESVDTACSSGLVALQGALDALRLGRCETAIVGGVNAVLSPTITIAHSRSGMLAPDGKIRTFDEKAGGYVRAEGVAALVLRPLEDALANGDPIWGLVKSVAVNHGGRANFLTSPNAGAQANVIREALREAGLPPEAISYVECHGTGTKLGDPIEIEGLKEAFRGASARIALGSVKPNIGHTEPVAGLAGLIKVLLCMQNRRLPALLHYRKQNPYFDLSGSPFVILEHEEPWEGEILRAGVSSFGMGGVNAHAILESHEWPQPKLQEFPDEYLVPFSAKPGRLEDLLRRQLEFLRECPESPEFLSDFSFTLRTGREIFKERVAFVVSTVGELIESLESRLGGVSDKRTHPPDLQKLASAWAEGAENTDTKDGPLPPGRRIPLPGNTKANRGLPRPLGRALPLVAGAQDPGPPDPSRSGSF